MAFGNFHLRYNDPHDIAAIIESYVLNVYNIQNITKGSVVVDVGAGIGEFAVLASSIVGKEGKVIAIEPSPDDFKTLTENLKANGCDNVIPLNIAVSDHAVDLTLEFKGKIFNTKADSLLNILNGVNVNLETVKFMKMDIEGAEKTVIPSSLDIIRKLNYLAMEIHDSYYRELLPIMTNLGFEFRRIKRSAYLFNAFKSLAMHTKDTYRLYSKFKETGENPGMGKIMGGIEISNSDNLVVGVFKKLET